MPSSSKYVSVKRVLNISCCGGFTQYRYNDFHIQVMNFANFRFGNFYIVKCQRGA
jgi:hypothetical protein